MFRAKDYRRAESLEEAYTLNQKRSNVLVGGMDRKEPSSTFPDWGWTALKRTGSSFP